MLRRIMLQLTQPVTGNYMKNIQATRCFSLSVTIRSFTHVHAHMYVCVCICMYVRTYVHKYTEVFSAYLPFDWKD